MTGYPRMRKSGRQPTRSTGSVAPHAVVEVGAGGAGEVSAGREADDADSRGVDVVVFGLKPHEPDGPLGVFKRGRMEWSGPLLVSNAVLQHECGDAELIEEFGDLLPFVVHRQPAVPTAGADHDGGPIRRLLGGRIDRDVRLVGLGIPHGVRNLALPERQDGRGGWLGEQNRRGEEVSGDMAESREEERRSNTGRYNTRAGTPAAVLGGELVSTGQCDLSVACRG